MGNMFSGLLGAQQGQQQGSLAGASPAAPQQQMQQQMGVNRSADPTRLGGLQVNNQAGSIVTYNGQAPTYITSNTGWMSLSSEDMAKIKEEKRQAILKQFLEMPCQSRDDLICYIRGRDAYSKLMNANGQTWGMQYYLTNSIPEGELVTLEMFEEAHAGTLIDSILEQESAS